MTTISCPWCRRTVEVVGGRIQDHRTRPSASAPICGGSGTPREAR